MTFSRSPALSGVPPKKSVSRSDHERSSTGVTVGWKTRARSAFSCDSTTIRRADSVGIDFRKNSSMRSVGSLS